MRQNLNSWRIFPYVKDGDKFSIADSYALQIWEKIKKHRLAEKTFVNGELKSGAEFLIYLKERSNIINFILDKDLNVIGMTWLNKWGWNHAFAHILFFPEAWGHTAGVMKDVLEYWFGFKNNNGKFLLDVIITQIPESNRLAIKLGLKCGFKLIGTIPEIIWNDFKKQKEGAAILYMQRGDLKNEGL